MINSQFPCQQPQYLKADGNYTELVYPGHPKHLMSRSLHYVIKKHYPHFIRIHKSTAVHPQCVLCIQDEAGELIVELAGNVRLQVSRRRKRYVLETFCEWMGSHRRFRMLDIQA